jgi:murein DD-endopeptidase MepM/ murein hydrolase activator NlpD
VYGAGRSYNGGPVTDYHKGTDIVAEEGAPVVAANTGRVAFAGSLSVRGGSVIVDHGAGVFSAYHHLSALAVVEGQLVTKGELVGAVGHTGLAEGPHLHWEIVVRGVEVDALLWTQAEYGPLPPS